MESKEKKGIVIDRELNIQKVQALRAIFKRK